jgi:glycerophosphoryl diester phosphodiesterase
VVKDHISVGEKMTGSPLIIAHRGDSAHAPENTLAAIKAAVAGGAEGVEFDVRLSSDGVPVVIHDETLKRTASVDDGISSLTATRLASIDVGTWFNRKFPKKANAQFSSERVSTLSEILAALRDFDGRIYVEMKSTPADIIGLPKAVCEVLRAEKGRSRFIVKSFNLGSLPIVRSLLPDISIAALFDVSITELLRRNSAIALLAREFCANEVSLHHALATPKLCRILNDVGLPITVWTVDKKNWIDKARKLGIGAIITNDPAKMLAVRSKS